MKLVAMNTDFFREKKIIYGEDGAGGNKRVRKKTRGSFDAAAQVHSRISNHLEEVCLPLSGLHAHRRGIHF